MLAREKVAAERALLAAMSITRRIQRTLTSGETITKADRSPVTLADFAVQALVCKWLSQALPHIPIVGEEDPATLQAEGNGVLLQRIAAELAAVDPEITAARAAECIGIGTGRTSSRFWTLDPIDGTKGFLRGEQFVIALALIEEGRVRLAYIGCPNLLMAGDATPGYLFMAEKGAGAMVRREEHPEWHRVTVSAETDLRRARMVESYESSHSDKELQSGIAERLGLAATPVQMDSQVKYGILAAGLGEIYLRIPNRRSWDYKEKIWDHAAGSLLVGEAGGVVSDVYGRPLDFGCGVTLAANTGILAANPCIYEQVLHTVTAALPR